MSTEHKIRADAKKKIVIKVNELEVIIEKIIRDSSSIHYAVPLGVFFSLIPNFFLVNAYKDFSNIHPILNSSSIQLIYIIILIIVLIWFIQCFSAHLRKKTKEMYIRDMMFLSENDNANIALYIIKAKIYDGSNQPTAKFLFRREPFWDMWVLPNFHVSDNLNDDQYAKKVFESIYPIKKADIEVKRCHQFDFSDEKMSPETGLLTNYNFIGYYVVINTECPFLFKESFQIGDIQHKWLTIEEVQNDKNTWERNKYVILRLKEELSSIACQFPNSCAFKVQG